MSRGPLRTCKPPSAGWEDIRGRRSSLGVDARAAGGGRWHAVACACGFGIIILGRRSVGEVKGLKDDMCLSVIILSSFSRDAIRRTGVVVAVFGSIGRLSAG